MAVQCNDSISIIVLYAKDNDRIVPNELMVKENNTAVFTCYAKYVRYWSFKHYSSNLGDQGIPNSDMEDNKLYIIAKKENQGDYTCRGVIDYGNFSATGHLKKLFVSTTDNLS